MLALKALQVIRVFDELIRPPGPKMVVCVEPSEGYFFRINTEPKWQVPVLLRHEDCRGFLYHDSYLECGSPLELGDYLVEQSLDRSGILGQLPVSYGLEICMALDRSRKISPASKELIRRALGC